MVNNSIPNSFKFFAGFLFYSKYTVHANLLPTIRWLPAYTDVQTAFCSDHWPVILKATVRPFLRVLLLWYVRYVRRSRGRAE